MRYPALHSQTMDLPRIALAGAQMGQMRRKNQLAQAVGQYAGPAMEGDQSALKKLAAIAPEKAQQIMEVGSQIAQYPYKRWQAQYAPVSETLNGLLMADPMQAAAAWPKVRAQAAQLGMDPSTLPEQWDRGWAQEQLIALGAMDEYIKETQGSIPSGMMRTPGGGLANMPGRVRGEAQVSGARSAASAAAKQRYEPPQIQTFYDEETGRKYRAQWNPQTQEWERVGGVEAGPDGDKRDRQINELVARGLDPDLASDLVDGRARIETTDEGRVLFVNESTGEAFEIPKERLPEGYGGTRSYGGAEGSPGAPSPELPPDIPSEGSGQESERPSVDPADIFGPEAYAAETIDRTLGAIFSDAQSPKVRRGRDLFRLVREEASRIFRSSGRVPLQEQQRILNIMPSTGLFESVGGAVNSLDEFTGEVRRIRETEEAFANDPENPDKLRREARDRVRQIDRLLDRTQRILDHSRAQIELGGGDISSMSLEELESLDPSTLNPEQLREATRRYNELVGQQ